MKVHYDVHCHMFTLDSVPVQASIKRFAAPIEHGMEELERRLKDVRGVKQYSVVVSYINEIRKKIKADREKRERGSQQKNSFNFFKPQLHTILGDLMDGYRDKLDMLEQFDSTQEQIFETVDEFVLALQGLSVLKEFDHYFFVPMTLHFGSSYKGNPFAEQWNRFCRQWNNSLKIMANNNYSVMPFYGVNLNDIINGVITLESIQENLIPGAIRSAGVESVIAYLQSGIVFTENAPFPIAGGIKIYPPLEENFPAIINSPELKEFWHFCIEERIPLTIHSSSGGYTMAQNSKEKRFASAEEWGRVLVDNPGLVVNFAHLGGGNEINDYQNGNHYNPWVSPILKHIEDENVYTDISYVSCEIPKELATFVKSQPLLHDKALWGTDWTMSMMENPNYVDAVEKCSNEFTPELLEKIATKNPEQFLWGTK